MPELIPRLMAPFLPEETRYRLRQHKLDIEAAEKAARVLPLPGVTVTVLHSTTGARSWRETTLVPTPTPPHMTAWWFTKGGLAWDGNLLTVTGDNNTSPHWPTAQGGVHPEFAADNVAQARHRPVTSGECPAAIVEIASIALQGHRPRRLYFLDEESRHLTMTPARGFTEDQLTTFAHHAGLTYRTYALTTGGTTTPDAMCEALFPRSARRRRVISENSPSAEWQWQGWP